MDSESDYIIWIKLNKWAFYRNEDLYIGVFLLFHRVTQGPQRITLNQYSVVGIVESSYLLCLLFISRFICTKR